jgi:hypothetical protein
LGESHECRPFGFFDQPYPLFGHSILRIEAQLPTNNTVLSPNLISKTLLFYAIITNQTKENPFHNLFAYYSDSETDNISESALSRLAIIYSKVEST